MCLAELRKASFTSSVSKAWVGWEGRSLHRAFGYAKTNKTINQHTYNKSQDHITWHKFGIDEGDYQAPGAI